MTAIYFSSVCLFIILLHSALSAEIKKRDTLEVVELDPIQQALLNQQLLEAEQEEWHTDREKRLGVIKTVGIKALLLNLIFNKIDRFIDSKTRLVNQLEKQNIIKNQKYFGITPPPRVPASQGGGGSGGSNVLSLVAGLSGSSSGGGGGGGAPRPTRPTTTTPEPIEFSASSPVSLVIPDRLYGNSFGLVTNISEAIGDVLFNTADRAQEFSNRLSEKVQRKFGFINLFANKT